MVCIFIYVISLWKPEDLCISICLRFSRCIEVFFFTYFCTWFCVFSLTTIENYSNGSFYKFNNGTYNYFSAEDGVILNRNEVAWIKVSEDAKIVLTEITE